MNARPAPAPATTPASVTTPSSAPSSRPAAPARPQAAPRRRPWSPASERALAMLRLFPVEEAALPRLHVEPARADGDLRVYDRPTGHRLRIYTPRIDEQFRAGHRARRWYVRPAGDAAAEPRGPGFASAGAALDAVAAGRWSFSALNAERRPPRLRVIWPR